MEHFYISENGKPEKILYISGNGTFLYFRKRNFLIFRERYIQNPSIFRTRAYSEHCQTSTMECFVKVATCRTFQPRPSKFFVLYFGKLKFFLRKWNFLALHFRKRNILIFQETELSCI